MSFYKMGDNALRVSMKLFAQNRQNLVNRLRKQPGLVSSSIVLLQGGQPITRHCTDHEDLFRQVRFCCDSNVQFIHVDLNSS